jgi:hypothetical protein
MAAGLGDTKGGTAMEMRGKALPGDHRIVSGGMNSRTWTSGGPPSTAGAERPEG